MYTNKVTKVPPIHILVKEAEKEKINIQSDT